jgi:hypothetical protein
MKVHGVHSAFIDVGFHLKQETAYNASLLPETILAWDITCSALITFS